MSSFLDYEIVNLTVSGRFSYDISLPKLYKNNPTVCNYNKELFTAASLSLGPGSTKMMVFINGKYVIVGAKTIEEINTCLLAAEEIIRPCKIEG